MSIGPDRDSATPITWEEQQDLIPAWVTTRDDLNRVERDNIAVAVRWARSRRWKPGAVLDEQALKRLHERMLKDVWRWAGDYRTTPREPIGVDHWSIGVEMRKTVADTAAQVHALAPEDDSLRDELAVRFHHRLVVVHPFPNGNGRWSRLAADVLAAALGRPWFTWGGPDADLRGAGPMRRAYIDALRAADGHDIEPLTHFARGDPLDASTA